MLEQFKKEIKEGLSKQNKTLPSKYFYDEIGDALFVKIMNMSEYYLTNSEFEIFSKKTDELLDKLSIDKNEPFELIELGAGDGTKTIELLKHLSQNQYKYSYLPVDISLHALEGLETKLGSILPQLEVVPKQGDYFEVLNSLNKNSVKKVVLFLGSNIGNLRDENAQRFITGLSENLNVDDQVVLGVDLIKPREVVLPAYSDSNGFTAEFNLNLLDRINKELNANFDRSNFHHLAEYTEEEGIAKSYLVSNIDQKVTISDLNCTFNFKKGEKIHTEISRKYNDELISEICKNSSLQIQAKIMDTKKYFADYILTKEE